MSERFIIMDSEQIYNDFITRYQAYPKQLASVVCGMRDRGEFSENIEDENYNLGTMGKGRHSSSEIFVMNAVSFRQAFEGYKSQNAEMNETEAKARVVFDFLKQNGVEGLSYEKDKDEVVFDYDKDTRVTRAQFYATSVYEDALTNTNYFDKHVGNAQLISLKQRDMAELSRIHADGFSEIPKEEQLEIIYKRGLYHESVHTALGTTDERKCDSFALLKVMKEHPKHAQTIFDMYNVQRSQMGYTLGRFYGKDEEAKQESVRGGAMTYIMPNTYSKLKQYAQNPSLIPQTDEGIMKLSCELTREPEFSKEQLSEFSKLMGKKGVTPQDLAKNEIVQSCMRQGGFESIDEFIANDKRLNAYFSAVKPPQIPNRFGTQSQDVLPPQIPKSQEKGTDTLRLAQIRNQKS